MLKYTIGSTVAALAVAANVAFALPPLPLDNDSGAHARPATPSVSQSSTAGQNPPASAPVQRRAPAVGDVSADGSAVWTGSDKGWEPRRHEYVVNQGKLVHEDKLGHQAPKPTAQETADVRGRMQELSRGG